jgi:hypothetical protein
MKTTPFSPAESQALAILAAAGFLVPNGIFVYFAVTDSALLLAALANPIAAVFIVEAFFLTALFAWLLGRDGSHRPSALGFVILSLLGSLAFSVPLTLRLVSEPGSESKE